MQELETAFIAKRWSEVLDALLHLWREGHSPAVADAIDAVSACLETFVDRPGGRTLRPALRALTRWKRPQLAIALDHLARWPADPRLGAWHAEQLNQVNRRAHGAESPLTYSKCGFF